MLFNAVHSVIYRLQATYAKRVAIIIEENDRIRNKRKKTKVTKGINKTPIIVKDNNEQDITMYKRDNKEMYKI
ncbi:hypothetical protein LAZ67_13001945 [Cordylochernes scorpioides]|uniref:Uncharacterized protein n=1 Tax=Cordylochernes scorpioides TaxID=51811 RepID=A0ABY6L486_9ARAC|nr:hypothetical protein LAZ67_13001945 [Cordylochernes scorpioides]